METQTKDLTDLRAFCMVVDRGSITAAAKALGETKGAVSRRITRLERAVGSPLLRRSPRLVQATENGIAYRVQVGRALELLDDATTVLQDARATPSGVLRVSRGDGEMMDHGFPLALYQRPAKGSAGHDHPLRWSHVPRIW